MESHVENVLRIYAGTDFLESLWWNSKLEMYATCSDVFQWACSDLEQILPEDIELLQFCKDDLKAAGATFYLSELFACRKRKMRPMRLWLGVDENYKQLPEGHLYRKRYDERVFQLFMDCGEERTKDSEEGFLINKETGQLEVNIL